MLEIKDQDESKLVPKDETAAEEEEEEAESLYKSSDLNEAIERGDTEDIDDLMESLTAVKVAQGKTEAQAKASVKSSVTSYWRKRYIAAWEENDTAEMKRILALLEASGIYGEYNDVATTAQKWIQNMK